jgi:signal transduction histidine kinase
VISQINQVVMNLLVNASHAIKEKGDYITGTEAGGVFISVADTGAAFRPTY